MLIFVKMEGPKPLKIDVWSGLGSYLEILGGTWALLGRSWNCFERLGEVLGASWVEPGTSWKGCEASWRRLGRLLRVFWAVLEASRDHPRKLEGTVRRSRA